MTLVRQGVALALGAGCGAVAAWAGLPLPWMLGPMIGTTIASMAAAPIAGPERLRPLVIPVIGVLLGAALTPQAFAALGQWGVTFALLPPFLLTTAAVAYLVYRRIGGLDPATAFFAAMPGGLNDMGLLGAAHGGDERRIALAHATRILVVITCVVLFYGLVLGARSGGPGGRWVGLDALGPADWAVLGACALIGAPLGRVLRLPAAPVFGPMILSGAAHLADIVTVAPPTIIVILAQIVVGTVIGCRFRDVPVRAVLRDIGLGTTASLAMIAVAAGFAAAIHATTGTDLAQAFLAYSPGGLAEMSLLALAMHQDVAYVSVTHVVRLFIVIGLADMVFRLIRRP